MKIHYLYWKGGEDILRVSVGTEQLLWSGGGWSGGLRQTNKFLILMWMVHSKTKHEIKNLLAVVSNSASA